MSRFTLPRDIYYGKDSLETLKTLNGKNAVNVLGGGPVITIGTNIFTRFARMLIEIARAKDIPYQLSAAPAHTGTNAWSMQIIEEGCATLVVSLPLKYMHSPVEVIKMSDVENVGRLMAELAMDIDGRWQL